MRTERILAALAFAATFAAPLAAQPVRIETEKVECLPIGENGVAYTQVANNVPDAETRLYFRRLNDSVEDLYWVRMKPAGQGRYWGVFPKAEDRLLQRHDIIQQREQAKAAESWAEWWRAKDSSDHRNPTQDLDQNLIRERASQGKLERRDWMSEMDDPSFQRWLEQLENEPTEYFTAVHDWQGKRLAKSPTEVAEVRKNCRVDLNPEQIGEAENMTVGETAYWQKDEGVFHWLCEGVVSRVDPTNVIRGDSVCRACVVAWWNKPALLIPAAAVATGAVAGVVLVEQDDPPPASPIRP